MNEIFKKQGMQIERVQTFNWENSIFGMRLPLNSEAQSDSMVNNGKFILGDKDKDLLIRLCIGGSAHRKVLRMIGISFMCKMPMTWFKHFETHKIGVTAISRSTMHKGIGSGILTREDDFYTSVWYPEHNQMLDAINTTKVIMDKSEDKNLKKVLWRKIIDLLPMCYCQQRMITINYEVALAILQLRYQVEKLDDEWTFFCETLLETCPHLNDIYLATKKNRQLTTDEFNALAKK